MCSITGEDLLTLQYQLAPVDNQTYFTCPVLHAVKYIDVKHRKGRPQWQSRIRCEYAAARVMGLRVKIPSRCAWVSEYCECCVLWGRGLCDELIPRPEESYRLWCDVVCDLETSWTRRPWSPGGCLAKNNKEMQTMSVRFSFVSLKVARGKKIIMGELCSHKWHLLARMLWTKFADHI